MTSSSEIRLARVAAQAQDVFESVDPAMSWLVMPRSIFWILMLELNRW
jgi:uncharacterized protein (DUF2384 family)